MPAVGPHGPTVDGLPLLCVIAFAAVGLGAAVVMVAPQSLDQRLTELDDLLRRGRITAAEHAASRAAARGTR